MLEDARESRHGTREKGPSPDNPAHAALLEDFRDEASALPHAAQLQKGFRWLRFMPQLESEFRQYYWQHHLQRARYALLVGALICIPFAIRDFFVLPAELGQTVAGVRVLWIMPLILLQAALTYVSRLKPYLEIMFSVTVFLIMASIALLLVLAAHAGTPLPYEGLMLVIVFVFFVGGLRTAKATISTILAVMVYASAAFMAGLPIGSTLQNLTFLMHMVVIGIVGGYLLESAVRRNFLTEKLAEFRASRDPLTLLHNRRSALQHLAHVWRVASREQVPVSVILLDVDHFKRYNDIYGHLAGDGCLSEVAITLAGCLQRPLDMVARYGGEEFIAIAYGTDGDGLHSICERMRQSIHNLAITHESSPPEGMLTVSIGATWALPANADAGPSAVIDEADRALYRAKELGRNRSEIYPGPPTLFAAAAAA